MIENLPINMYLYNNNEMSRFCSVIYLKLCHCILVRERVERLEMLMAERNTSEIPTHDLTVSSSVNLSSSEQTPTNHTHSLLASTPFKKYKIKTCESQGSEVNMQALGIIIALTPFTRAIDVLHSHKSPSLKINVADNHTEEQQCILVGPSTFHNREKRQFGCQ